MSTGSDEMSVFQMLSDGNIGHPGAPGTGVPARAGGASSATVTELSAATERARTPKAAAGVRRPERHEDLPPMGPFIGTPVAGIETTSNPSRPRARRVAAPVMKFPARPADNRGGDGEEDRRAVVTHLVN